MAKFGPRVFDVILSDLEWGTLRVLVNPNLELREGAMGCSHTKRNDSGMCVACGDGAVMVDEFHTMPADDGGQVVGVHTAGGYKPMPIFTEENNPDGPPMDVVVADGHAGIGIDENGRMFKNGVHVHGPKTVELPAGSNFTFSKECTEAMEKAFREAMAKTPIPPPAADGQTCKGTPGAEPSKPTKIVNLIKRRQQEFRAAMEGVPPEYEAVAAFDRAINALAQERAKFLLALPASVRQAIVDRQVRAIEQEANAVRMAGFFNSLPADETRCPHGGPKSGGCADFLNDMAFRMGGR